MFIKGQFWKTSDIPGELPKSLPLPVVSMSPISWPFRVLGVIGSCSFHSTFEAPSPMSGWPCLLPHTVTVRPWVSCWKPGTMSTPWCPWGKRSPRVCRVPYMTPRDACRVSELHAGLGTTSSLRSENGLDQKLILWSLRMSWGLEGTKASRVLWLRAGVLKLLNCPSNSSSNCWRTRTIVLKKQ